MEGLKLGQPVMMQLGGFQFGTATAAYQELRRVSEWRWSSQELFGKMDALQFTGPGGDTMTLPGVIYPEWRGGFGQLSQMRALAAQGQPQRLVDGNGTSLGRWVVERVEEGQTVFADAGMPRRMEFTLQLRRFNDEDGGAAGLFAAITSLPAAIAMASIPADATGAVAQVKGLAGSVSSTAKSLSGALAKAADQVESAVAPFSAIAKDALGGLSRSLAVVSELQDIANRTLSSVGIKPTAINARLGADNLAARASRLVVNVESASAVLRTSSERLAQLPSVPAAATKAMQDAQVSATRAVALTRQTAAQAATIKE